jgi:heavy metal sensor kinase
LFFKSIRIKLTLLYSVTLAIVLALFSSFLYLTIREELYREVDRDITAVAEALASPTMEPFRNSAPAVFDQVLEDFIGPKIAGKYVQLYDSAGRITSRSKNLQDINFPLSKGAIKKVLSGTTIYDSNTVPRLEPLRTIAFPIFADERVVGIVRVAASLRDAAETLDKILLVFFVLFPVSLLLLTYGGWFLAGRALKPVDVITQSARRISAENLSQRLEVVNPDDEIGKLAVTFNATLERLENAFNREKQFSTDVSHELRTPLTILQGGTEVGLKWAKEPEEFREILQSNLEEIAKMTEIIEYLLEQSRAEEENFSISGEEIELRELLLDLNQQLKCLAQDKNLALHFDCECPAKVRGDALRLRQMFLNILDNAIKYTPSGGAVRVQLDADTTQAWVTIIDTGAGIPSEHLSFIFDRFYRVDKARNREHGGSGLGLALVKSIAKAHGGRIEVLSEVGKGSVFTVYLPLLA